jgi:hypothetical protein
LLQGGGTVNALTLGEVLEAAIAVEHDHAVLKCVEGAVEASQNLLEVLRGFMGDCEDPELHGAFVRLEDELRGLLHPQDGAVVPTVKRLWRERGLG